MNLKFHHFDNNYQLLDEYEQNIVICRWREDQLSPDGEGRGKSFICDPPTNHDMREPSSIIVLLFSYLISCMTLKLGTTSFSHKPFEC